RVPADALDADTDLLAQKRDELMQLGSSAVAPASVAGAAPDADATDTERHDDAVRKVAGQGQRTVPSREAQDVDAATVSRPKSARDRALPSVNANGKITGDEAATKRSVTKANELAGASGPGPKATLQRQDKPLEPSVFIVPRAPDDPGPKSAEGVGERQTASR